MNATIAKFSSMAVITVFVTMTIGCSQEANRDMDGVIMSIRAEYAVVAPSLLQAARKLVADQEPDGVRFKGKPCVECDMATKRLPAEDGDITDPPKQTETTFSVWAVECVMSYGPPEIGQIDKHLSPQVPFTATVRVPVTTSYRRSEKLQYIHRSHLAFFGTAYGGNYSLLVPYGMQSLPKSYPPEVHRLAEKTKLACLKADQTTDPTKTEIVRFEYHADKAEWVPQPRR